MLAKMNSETLVTTIRSITTYITITKKGPVETNLLIVYEQFMQHPGLIRKKLHVVYLKAQGLAHKEIERIARTRLTA